MAHDRKLYLDFNALPGLMPCAVLSCCVVLVTGCKIPWNPMKGSEPSYERLLEAEQRQTGRKGLSSRIRPRGAQDDPDRRFSDREELYDDEDTYADVEVGSDSASDPLADDELYQEAYAESTASERALLDRFSKTLRKNQQETSSRKPNIREDGSRRNRTGTDRETYAGNDPFGEATDNDGTSFKMSDIRDVAPRAILGEDSHPRLARNLTTEYGSQGPDSKVRRASARENDLGAIQRAAYDESIADPRHEPIPEQMRKFADSEQVENAPRSLRDLGHAMLASLDEDLAKTTNPDEKTIITRNQRLISFVLNDLDAAQEPIEGLQKEAQEYFRQMLQGLYDATDIDGNPVASRRLTLALQSHRDASMNLSKLANLEVLNASFCTEVDSFGVVTKFPAYEFTGEQEVLLYCELENFVSRIVKDSKYETQLQGSYEITDSKGRKVADQLLPEDTDICGKTRRDFYIAYRLHMPASIEPGRYKLKLTIEDMIGHKFGQATVDFQIVR